MLIWTFDFLRRDEEVQGGQRLLHARSYVNGKYREGYEDINKNYLFLSYLTLFPGKEVIKIKLNITDSNEFIIHYLEKRYIDSGLIGVLTVQEIDVDCPFASWGSEDLIAQYVFGTYFDRVMMGELCTADEILEFHNWLDEEIDEYYKEWVDEREKFYTSNRIKEINDGNGEQFWSNIDTLWEFQFINEFGFPISDIMKYKNGVKQDWGTDEDINFQNLESITISVLKSILDQSKSRKKLQIDYFKVKLNDKEGYSYVFFYQCEFDGVGIVLLLSVAYWHKGLKQMIQYFKGCERKILDEIGRTLKDDPSILGPVNVFLKEQNHTKVEELIAKTIKENDKVLLEINDSF